MIKQVKARASRKSSNPLPPSPENKRINEYKSPSPEITSKNLVERFMQLSQNNSQRLDDEVKNKCVFEIRPPDIS